VDGNAEAVVLEVEGLVLKEEEDSRRLRQDWGDEHVDVAWQHVRGRESGEGEDEYQMLIRRQECCGWREECGRFWHLGGRRAMMRRTA